ncbi:hypothetical protein CJJ23_01140 [Mycoplasmopsis agassizii]|uniref:Ribulose-phosphate 3-epimerase n=1 Tax=Mycoplasmopsis agassizii TaxID=33922 RepID=A0A269TJF6_9BACT|nr:hypothetical protein [Mycoplasmopsis agassizii]PAK21541.1 hypothetical protein CJJ23_01140 [Mycoplasmopsis agassizii]
MILIPSVSAAKNKTNLDYPKELVDRLIDSGFNHFHLDLTDGTITSENDLSLINLNYDAEDITFDYHIMSANPLAIIMQINERKNTYVNAHYKYLNNIQKYIALLKSKNLFVGITVELDDDFSKISNHIDQINLINFMSVSKLGKTNLTFDENVFKKVQDFKKHYQNYQGKIMVDGSVRNIHLKKLSALIDFCIVGSILLKNDDFKNNLKNLRKEFI